MRAGSHTDRLVIDEVFVQDCYRVKGRRFETVVDVGANIGAFARAVEATTVVAFEPDPGNYSLLERNARDARCLEAAVWASTGVVSFASNYGDTTTGSGDGLCVAVSLADAIGGYDRVSLLKLDCEGAEYPIVAAGYEALRRVDEIAMEVHEPFPGYRVGDLLGALNELFEVTFEPLRERSATNEIGLLWGRRRGTD